MPKVTTGEALQVRVAQFITEQGYRTTVYTVESDVVGYLCRVDIWDKTEVPESFLMFRWNSIEEHITAEVHLSNERIGVQKKNWVVHVYGRQFFDRITTVAKAAALKFDVDIHVRLEQEERKLSPNEERRYAPVNYG